MHRLIRATRLRYETPRVLGSINMVREGVRYTGKAAARIDTMGVVIGVIGTVVAVGSVAYALVRPS